MVENENEIVKIVIVIVGLEGPVLGRDLALALDTRRTLRNNNSDIPCPCPYPYPYRNLHPHRHHLQKHKDAPGGRKEFVDIPYLGVDNVELDSDRGSRAVIVVVVVVAAAGAVGADDDVGFDVERGVEVLSIDRSPLLLP